MSRADAPALDSIRPSLRCAAVVLAAGSSLRLGQSKQMVRLGSGPGSGPGGGPGIRDGEAFGDETLLERAVRVAYQAGLRPVLVVAQQPEVLARITAALGADVVVWVENREAAEGMASSIRAGVRAAMRFGRHSEAPNRFDVIVDSEGAVSSEAAINAEDADSPEDAVSLEAANTQADRSQALNGLIVMACDQPAVTADHLRRLIVCRVDHSVGNRVSDRVSDRVVASAYAGRNGVPAYFPRSEFKALLALTGDSGARGLLVEAQAIELPLGEIDVDTPGDLAQARRLFC